MASNTFVNKTIYKYFRLNDEFRFKLHTSKTLSYENNKTPWKTFIESKDLGVICLSYLNDEYRIVDEKKWALSKIKYGF